MQAQMTRVEDNVVESVLQCLRLVEEKHAAMGEKDAAGEKQVKGEKHAKCEKPTKGEKHAKSTDVSVEAARELLFDVRIALCRLASALVTAPITGRIFLPLPPSYVSPEDAHRSLRAQLGQTVDP